MCQPTTLVAAGKPRKGRRDHVGKHSSANAALNCNAFADRTTYAIQSPFHEVQDKTVVEVTEQQEAMRQPAINLAAASGSSRAAA